MPYFIKCNKVMRWWLILVVLLATSAGCKSWESGSDSYSNDDTHSGEDRTEGNQNLASSSIADEGSDNIDSDDTVYSKSVEQKATESLQAITPETNITLLGDVGFSTEKVFFTTDHTLADDVILKGDRSSSVSKNLSTETGKPAGKRTTDNGFRTSTKMLTIPRRTTVHTNSTGKYSPAVTEKIAKAGFLKNDISSTIKSKVRTETVHHNESRRTKKYEKMFPNNYSETTTAKFCNDSITNCKRKRKEYTFWRDVNQPNATRRMFGGSKAGPEAAQGRAVALLDDAGRVHCSGAALTRMWILTVAHCLAKSVTLVQAAYDLRYVPIRNLYTHRYYKNEMKAADEGGLAVTSLQHDIGLAELTRPLHLLNIPPLNEILADMQKHFVSELNGQEVSVFGFGHHEGAAHGAQLFSIRTTVKPCSSRAWVPCVCSAGTKGVCVGDSGGPVFYKDAQVAITSLGPMSCSPSEADSNVFTTLQTYVPLLRSTIPAMPHFRQAIVPPRPTEPKPDDYWLTLRIRGAAPCVVVKKLLFVLVPLAVHAL